MTRPGIEPRSPGPLANTLTAEPYNKTKNNFNNLMINLIHTLLIRKILGEIFILEDILQS